MTVDVKRRSMLLGTATAATLATLSALADLASAQSNGKRRRMPVIFVGHGGPMNALQTNAFTNHLKAWGKALPSPAALLSISAHWLTPGVTAVVSQERPRTIHDFGGFPQALFNMRYPAPGAPSIARQLATLLVKHQKVALSSDWGLDHGTWTVLHHMYPNADIPVLQLSIDYDRRADYHYAIGRELNALRDKGVLIMGSGNIVHNLRMLDRGVLEGTQASRPWAQGFDAAVKNAMDTRNDRQLINYERLDGAQLAVPTPDHYYPLLYALGAADQDESAKSVFEGFQSGTISMRCVQFGA